MVKGLIEDGQYFKDDKGRFHESNTDFIQSQLDFCGCGNPNAALIFVGQVLELLKQRKGVSEEMDKLLPSDGVYYFVLYMLDNLGYTLHGGSVGSSWLSEKGEQLLEDINWCVKNEMTND
jgi:hypothetical protein